MSTLYERLLHRLEGAAPDHEERVEAAVRAVVERKEGTLGESPAFQRYRWLEATARGIEDGAGDLAELLGVEEHEIERLDHG